MAMSYWVNRLEKEQYKTATQELRALEKAYKLAMNNINSTIKSYINDFAENNEISYRKALKKLTSKQLEPFKWTLEDYIKEAQKDPYNRQVINSSIKARLSRLEALKIQIGYELDKMYSEMERTTERVLNEIARDSYYKTLYNTDGTEFHILDDKTIKSFTRRKWVGDGLNYSQRIWNDRKKLASTLEKGIMEHLVTGGDINKVINSLTGFVDEKVYNRRAVSARLVYTEMSAVRSVATEEAYQELGVEKYKIVATLDNRTSKICRNMDGKVFDKKDYQVGVTAPPFHINCFDKETEVLTSEGWKFFKDLNNEELVYTIDKDTLIPYWQKPIKYINYKHKGKMLHFKNARFDLMVTPNHNLLVQNMDSSVKDKNWKLRRADTIGKKSKNRMLGGANWNGETKEFETLAGKVVPIETYLKFMAYWLADGSCTKNRNSYAIKIAQQNNDWMYEELKELPFKIYKCKESLMIHDKELGEELKKYGKCTTKYIPDNIKNLSPNLIRIFLLAYSKTDGIVKKGKMWKGYQFQESISFFTTSDKLASDLGELILKAGGRPSYAVNKSKGRVIEFRNGKYTINNDCWVINWNKQLYTWVAYTEVSEVNYNDDVYCVEVPLHNTLLVRRNGKVCWSGNCRSTTVPYFDDEDTEGERVARGEDNKQYNIPSKMTYDEWYNKYVLKKGDKTDIIELNENTDSSLIKVCIKNKIEYKGIKKYSVIPSENEIIAALGGGDLTKGSCSSLAFAYAGNKNGYRVLDFRGGGSRLLFSAKDNIVEVAKLDNVKSWIVKEKNDFVAIKRLIVNTEVGKEYYLGIGKHAAIIRKTEKQFEYLELQSATENGFKHLNMNVLKDRFGCRKAHRVGGTTVELQSVLIDIDTLKGNEEFKQLLGFINTAEDKQVKGAGGYEK